LLTSGNGLGIAVIEVSSAILAALVGNSSETVTGTFQRRARSLSSLCTHLQQNSEREKSLLARTLHDELGGLLVATKMDMAWLRRKLDDPDPAISLHWDRAVRSLEQAIDCKRRIIENLRPTLLDNLGLVAALRWLIDESCREAGLQYEQILPEEGVELGNSQSIALFRVVQEALSNIVRHAHASRIVVEMINDDSYVTLLVQDDGVGIDSDRLESDESHGIAGMRQRVLALKGILTVGTSVDGHGTTVLARVPRVDLQETS
jgi:signal transduction histidine kinase